MTNVSSIDLVCVPSSFGHGANDGAYYPIGLLTLATHLKRTYRECDPIIWDLHHENACAGTAPVVGISATSTLNYKHVLAVAEKAKAAGKTIILGGGHATVLARQIMRNRKDVVDFVIRGFGEDALAAFLRSFKHGRRFDAVPGLVWRRDNGEIVENASDAQSEADWDYERFLPFDFSRLHCGIEPYWRAFQDRLDPTVDHAFALFTHFGCARKGKPPIPSRIPQQLSNFCLYCSLSNYRKTRSATQVVEEAIGLLRSNNVPYGSKVLLKCYGDNIGYQRPLLQDLANAICQEAEWRRYDIGWTVYSQSNMLDDEMGDLLVSIGTRNVFIGFDCADDSVQRMNGLGTTLADHRRAVQVCRDRGIRIQAALMPGLAGETRGSLENTYRFAEEMANTGVLDRINISIMVVMPGAANYTLLCAKEPWLREHDLLDTEETRYLWIRHFCPDLGNSPLAASDCLQEFANRINALYDGPCSSMGFLSSKSFGGGEDCISARRRNGDGPGSR